MHQFFDWFNQDAEDFVIKSGVAHLWYLTVHPFEDGNGRIARALSAMLLTRSENGTQRFYSLSSQIERERNDYYLLLERTQKGSLEITEWLEWYFECLNRAIQGAHELLGNVLRKSQFWKRAAVLKLNDRQVKMLNQLIDGFEGKLTTSKYAKLAKCSQDTAHRDILDLIEKEILMKDSSGGRSTSYSLKE